MQKTKNLKADPLLCSFEELPDILTKGDAPRFVSLGLTVINYHPDEILPLMKKIAGEDGYVFVNIQVRERLDMEELRKCYVDFAEGFFNQKMKLIGIAPEDIQIIPDDKITMSGVLKKSNPIVEKKDVRVGDKIIVSRSLRHTEEYFTQQVVKYFRNYRKFDTGDSYIGYLLIN